MDTFRRLRLNAYKPDSHALKDLIAVMQSEFGDLAIEQRPDRVMGQITELDTAGVYHDTTTVAIWDLSSRRWDEPYGFAFLIQDAYSVYEL